MLQPKDILVDLEKVNRTEEYLDENRKEGVIYGGQLDVNDSIWLTSTSLSSNPFWNMTASQSQQAYTTNATNLANRLLGGTFR